MSEKKLTAMSASRIKAAKECSFKYYCKYHLKLPETTNSGALMGGIVHEVLEYIFKEEDRFTFNYARTNGYSDLESYIPKTIKQEAVKFGVDTEEQIRLMITMTNAALSHDFYGESIEKPSESHAELDFDLEVNSDHGEFRILGFIDQLFVYPSKRILVRDFKTSKKVFEGADAEDNLQDSMYNYAVTHMFPENETSNTEFLFLKFDLGGVGTLSMPPISKYEFKALEMDLSGWQQFFQNFNEEQALKNLAAKKDYPTDSSFTGPLMCGFAKYPGQLKKDGTLMFHCPYKFPFEYYAVVDKDGNRGKGFFEAEGPKYRALLKEGETIKKFKFNGCPHFNR